MFGYLAVIFLKDLMFLVIDRKEIKVKEMTQRCYSIVIFLIIFILEGNRLRHYFYYFFLWKSVIVFVIISQTIKKNNNNNCKLSLAENLNNNFFSHFVIRFKNLEIFFSIGDK
jgi:hypothetical protein